MSNLHLFVNPHTLEVTEEKCKKCSECKRLRPYSAFHRAVRGQVTPKCKSCYKDYHRLKNEKRRKLPLREKINICVGRANKRSRYRRSNGPDLTTQDAMDAWTGRCANCSHELTFDWWPRRANENLAIIDRVETGDNRSYHNNFVWLCNLCNTEKGGFDLCEQKEKEIEELRRRLAARERASVPYESILIS